MPPPKKKFTLPFGRWLLLLPIPVFWCLLSHFGWLAFFEDRTIDWRFWARGEIPAPVKIVYVDVDSRSLDDIGNFPWSRHYFATVSEKLLSEAHVKAIGFDFVISPNGQAESADKDYLRAGDLEFAKFTFTLPPKVPPPVVLAASFSAAEFRGTDGRLASRGLPLVVSDKREISAIEPPEVTSFEIGRPAPIKPPFVGLIDTLNGGTRTVPVWAPTSVGNFYHLSLELARLYWGLPVGSIKAEDDHLDFLNADGTVHARMPLRDRQLVDINWFSSWESQYNPRQSFSIVYTYATMLDSDKEEERKSAREFFAQDAWKDAVVLIGPVDPLLQDVAPTPVDDAPVARVGVHGNMLKTIISGLYLTRLPSSVEYLIVFGLTGLVSAFAAAGGTRGLRAKLTAALLLAAYVFLTFQIFASQHLMLPLTAPLGSIFTTSFTAIIWQLILEEKQKGRIKGMFGAYVSPQLVHRMVESAEDPQLGGHEDEITAYFSDIQSFSTFSEKLPPAKLVELMNEYLTACTDIVQAQGGTLDKYIGDAVVAMFGAPVPLKDHAFRACVATQLVHQQLGELRNKWKSEGDKWPEIVWKMQSRIGLNSGMATIGNMGSRTRFNYTMMGDNVNLAARMESGAKSWGAYTMVTEVTRAACVQHGGDRVVFRPLGRIVVMGRSKPVPIFEIVGLKETVAQPAHDCIGLFEQAMARYYARDWDGAIALFKQSVELEPNQPGKTPGVKTNPSLVYIAIAEDYKVEPPPENWDGVYVMKEK